MLRYLAETEPSGRWEAQLICRRDGDIDAWAADLSKYCTVFRLDVSRPADLLQISRLVRRASLVHLNLSFPAGKYQFTTAAITQTAGRPLVVTHHLALPVHLPWSAAMRWLGRRARRHIAVSHNARATLMREYDYPPERVIVIYNGIDPDRFRPASHEGRKAFRQAAGELLEGRRWGDDVLLACTVARLSPQKGLFELIGASDLIVKRDPSARVVVIGEGELRRRLDEQVRSRGLEHHVFFAGALPRQQVAEWLAAADLFILPSRYEGGPATALMEAMASGCAVIATDVSGVSELISDAGVGRLVPVQDIAALAAAAGELLGSPALRAEMAANARHRVVENFTIATSLKRTVAIFEEVLDEARR